MNDSDSLEFQVAYHGGTVDVLAEDKWLSLRSMKVPELGITGYTYTHNPHCHGHAVAVLPFINGGYDEMQVLLREEIVPPWGLAPTRCAITGAWDHTGETYHATAARELYEEGGFSVEPEKLIPLGTCRGTKATDIVIHLYAADVTGMTALDTLPGDGSSLEQIASTYWCDVKEAGQSQDPLIGVMLMRYLSR